MNSRTAGEIGRFKMGAVLLKIDEKALFFDPQKPCFSSFVFTVEITGLPFAPLCKVLIYFILYPFLAWGRGRKSGVFGEGGWGSALAAHSRSIGPGPGPHFSYLQVCACRD
jgi:hypothetical protein